jgi:[ribosomal protein S5]-alanine N-acetyltransferase
MGKPGVMIPPATIHTPRLILCRSTVGRLSALITGPHEYQRVFGQAVEDGYVSSPGILEFSLHHAQAATDDRPWWLLYLIVERGHDRLIGLCGYAGPPDEDGFVEICYGVAPALSGRGFATEAALALATHAFELPAVTGIRAHTHPGHGASTRILTKCGFTRTGDFDDPDEGRVWRWELLKSVPSLM